MNKEINVQWKSISQELLEVLNKEWVENKNVNAFLFANFVETYPVFEKDYCVKGIPNKEHYFLKKSLLDRFVNKVMTNGHKNTGKKVKALKLITQVLSLKAEKYQLSMTSLLILLLVRTCPNYTIRRLKFGSGHITRAVSLTICRKITWFLVSFAKVFKIKNTPFCKKVGDEIDNILQNSPRSMLLSLKREQLSQAEKANIQ